MNTIFAKMTPKKILASLLLITQFLLTVPVVAFAQNANISGSILLSNDGPVTNTPISFSGQNGSAYLTTDVNGTFQTSDLPDGQYYIYTELPVEVTEMLPAQYMSIIVSTVSNVSAVRSAIPPSILQEDGSIKIQLSAPQVMGKVTKADGSALDVGQSCSVSLNNSTYTVNKYSNTDTLGIYKFAGLTNGETYTIRFNCSISGFVAPNDVTFTYNGTTLNYGDTDSVVLVRLQEPQIRGVLYDPSDVLLTSMTNISLTNTTGTIYKYANSDFSDASFGFGGLADGNYKISFGSIFDHPEWLPIDQINVTLAGGVVTETTPSEILQGDGSLKIRYIMADKYIVGTVKYANGNAAEDVRVNASKMSSTGSTFSSVTALPDGSFSIPVSSGSWQVSIYSNAMQGESLWSYSGFGQNITVGTGAGNYPSGGSVDFKVRATDSTVTGNIYLGASGTTVPEPGSFYASLTDGVQYTSINTNPDGSFTAKVPSGKYTLSIYSSKYNCPKIDASVFQAGNNVLPDIRLTEKTEFISGHVADESGTPMTNTSIFGNSTTGYQYAHVLTDSNGNYTLPVSVGEWMIMPSSNYATDTFYTGGPVTKTLVKDQTISGVNFTLQKATITISGSIVDPNQDLISDLNGGYVWLSKGTTQSLPLSSDKTTSGGGGGGSFSNGSVVTNGTFSFKTLPGVYKLYVGFGNNSLYNVAPITLDIQANQNITITATESDAKIKGSLKSVSGDVISGLYASISLNDGDGNYRWTNVDSATGSYELFVNSGESYTISTWIDTNAVSADGKSYVIAQNNLAVNNTAIGDNIRDITLVEANRQIVGSVTDSTGSSVPYAQVYANNNTSSAVGNYDNSVMTDSEGNYTIKLPSGTYKVGVGYAQEMLTAGQMPPSKATVTVNSDNSPLTHNFQYTSVDGLISGNVTGGNQYGHTIVSAWSNSGKSITKEVSGSSSYSLNVTDNETWHISASQETIHATNGQRIFFKSPEYVIVLGDNQSKVVNLALSSSPQSLPKTVSESFDSKTEKVITLDDGTKVDIPASGIQESGLVTVTATAKAEYNITNEVKPIGIAYKLEAVNSQGNVIESFLKPVKISFPYTHAQVTALGMNEDDLTAAYWDESSMTWKVSPNVVVDKTLNIITVTVTHFSSWALISTNTGVSKNPVYRFWSDSKQGHFYTASLAEKNSVIANMPEWKYEGVSYDSYDSDTVALVPVYRFWSNTKQHHFYTSNASEKDYVIANYSDDVWKYEGIAYYTYPNNSAGTAPVYRFWSDSKQGHFYTSSKSEKDYIIATYPEDIWKYEGVAYYTPQ